MLNKSIVLTYGDIQFRTKINGIVSLDNKIVLFLFEVFKPQVDAFEGKIYSFEDLKHLDLAGFQYRFNGYIDKEGKFIFLSPDVITMEEPLEFINKIMAKELSL